ncbi:carbohydrate kinase family protein [Chloroflexota bacterium]
MAKMPRYKYDCLVIGDALWDVYITADHYRLKHGGTHYCTSAGLSPGGLGNVAVAIGYLGGKAAFIGKTGIDILGRLYRQDLENNHVAVHLATNEQLATGLVNTYIDGRGERTFVVFRGAADTLSLEDINRPDYLYQARYIYISGFSLLNTLITDTILGVVEKAGTAGGKIVFGAGAHNLITSHRDAFDAVMQGCDIICANIKEGQAITGEDSPEEIMKQLNARFKVSALTMGEKGCMLASSDEVVTIDGFKTDYVDTTGAGDAFAAALVYGLCRGWPLIKTGKLANWLAARVTEGYGARHLPAKEELDRFISALDQA